MRRSFRYGLVRTALLVLSSWLLPAIAAAPLYAAVVVIANKTDHTVDLSLGPLWGQTRPFSLAAGKTIRVPVPGAVEIDFHASMTSQVHRLLKPNTVQIFTVQGEERQLKQAAFPRSPGVSWLEQKASGPPEPAVVPVKILADKEASDRGGWEAKLREQVAAASQFFETWAGVRLSVVAVDAWQPEGDHHELTQLDDDFRRKATCEPAWLAIGVSGRLKAGDPASLAQLDRQPLCTHLLLPDVQNGFTSEDQLKLLIHELGHYLGAVHSSQSDSVMRAKYFEKQAGAPAIDPVNALVMSLIGDEIRSRGGRSLASLPRSTRQFLHAIYVEQARAESEPQATQFASLFDETVVRGLRYAARWGDGSQLTADQVGPWNDANASPSLAGRALLDPKRPVRWLVDNTLAPLAAPPQAMVELVGGDRLPGRVVGFRSAVETGLDRQPAYLLVEPSTPLDWPDGPSRTNLRVSSEWVRRIVWKPLADRYQPQTLILDDGRELRFRAVRLGESSIKLLQEDGVREVPWSEAAELHLPAVDPWDAYFREVSELSPDGTSRLVQIETVGGLRVTGSAERFQARSNRGGDPNGWYHLFQPVWCPEPLWIQHQTIRLRRYYLPQEVPLSRIEPCGGRQQSDLGGVWPMEIDRNAEGGPLRCGGLDFAWGLGVHAFQEIEFPLPACARSFSSRLGLDHLAGDGGSVEASVRLSPPGGKNPLFATGLVVGSADLLDTGVLPLASSGLAARKLILQVDSQSTGQPITVDPLDIRDTFDWLEPLVELDADQLHEELFRRAPQRVPAWQVWSVTTGGREGARLVNFWDERDQADQAYRLLASAEKPLRLSLRTRLSPARYRLTLAVSRPPQSAASKIEVRVSGQVVGQYDVPVRSDRRPPEPLSVLLSKYEGQEVLLELVQQSPDPRALVEWRAITLAGSPVPGG
jgi:hypothetical protein